MSRFPDLERFPVLAHAGGSCPVDAEAFVWPVYRGEENEALGVRRICGLAWQFVWQHDGADDDIVGYRISEAPGE